MTTERTTEPNAETPNPLQLPSPATTTDTPAGEASASGEGPDEAPDAEEASNEDADEANDARGSSREAARYRRRLREAESERDALRRRLDAVQRREVEGLAETKLAQGGDLLRFGADLADLLDEAGEVSPAKVTAAAEELATARPGLAAAARGFDFGGGNRGTTPKAGGDWAHAFMP